MVRVLAMTRRSGLSVPTTRAAASASVNDFQGFTTFAMLKKYRPAGGSYQGPSTRRGNVIGRMIETHLEEMRTRGPG